MRKGKNNAFLLFFLSLFVFVLSLSAFGIHEHTYFETLVEPTCTERGYTKHTCTVCGESFSDSFVRENGHDVIIQKEVPATCTEKGKTAGMYCGVCKKVLNGLEETEALGHQTVSDKNGAKPTCTEKGKTASEHCKRCDFIVPSKTLPALGHEILKDLQKEPTCSRQGKTEGEHCSRCDYKIVQKTIPALGHSIVIDSAVKATCTKGGLSAGKHCTRTGCDYFEPQDKIAPLGHNIVTIEEKKAACTTAGRTKGEYCTRCNYTVGQKPIPALGHSIVIDSAVKATCTKSGLTEGKHCTRCDYRLAQNTVAPLGHNIVKDKAVSATCTKAGKTQGEHCSRCDYKVAQRETSLKPHEFQTYIVKATFSKDGYITEKCSVCKTYGKKKNAIFAATSATLSKNEVVYNGKAQTPKFVVKDKNGKLLKENADYTVSYSENKNVGKAFAKLTLKGNYNGTKTLSFKILPPGVENVSLSQKTTEVSLKWSKAAGANG
ncbi:MAG: hypothetical protein Q4D20_01320 [Clostridia bacterium]|nr:hypothetical protein [Clostridia bacterium]